LTQKCAELFWRFSKPHNLVSLVHGKTEQNSNFAQSLEAQIDPPSVASATYAAAGIR
jgi:hypothetical protein